MPLLIGLMLQAIASAPPERIDLTAPRPCAGQRSSDGEILVCARRGDGPGPYRIAPAPAARPDGLPKAEVKLAGGVVASAETESHDVGGFPSKRALLRFRVRF